MGLRGGSQAPTRRRFLLEIKSVGDKALKETVKSLRNIERSTGRLQRGLGGLRNLFFATFAGVGVSQITQAADSIQLLSDRINIFTGDSIEGARALDVLFQAADDTNTSIDSLAETFNRVALATQELGLTTNELIGFTATLQNTFRLSGASIAESSAAAIQLSQGLASGQLRGQELRSVLEQNAVIGQILAETLNTTRGNLIKFAESGKITSEVVLTALAANAEKLNEQAKGLGQTFGQTIIKALNRVKQNINDLNKRLKLNEKFAVAVGTLVENLDKLAIVLAGIGSVAVLTNINKLAGAFVLLANPLIAIGAAAGAIVAFRKEIGGILAELIAEFQVFLKEIEIDFREFLRDITKNAGFLGKIFGGNDAKDRIKQNERELATRKLILEQIIKSNAENNKPQRTDVIKAFSQGNFKQVLKENALSLERLNFLFREGFVDINRYRRELTEIEKRSLKKQFDEGNISLMEYQRSLVELGDEADTTFGKLRQGFELGSREYVRSLENLTLQFSDLVSSTFGNLENAIFDFTKGTGDAFAKLTQQILDDLLKIAIRARIISPIAGSFEGLFSPSSGAGVGVNGNFSSNPASTVDAQFARQGQVFKYAQGGIVNRPTAFPMSKGTGFMAEAGAPEAVVPLTRTSDGDLGVQAIPNNVVVNVNNQTSGEVQVDSFQDGNTQVLDITVTRAVNKAINEGRLDRSLSSNFGLNRRGNR